ncbi:MAG: RHS repeat protein, partial [Bacteroidetes bacterium]|nr:RHS repeat protein [Bacteroidota bacterium]
MNHDTSLRAYLFETQAILAQEKIHGDGTYDHSTATVDQVTVNDGWSLRSWANPDGVLSFNSGIPVTAVALRTRTWTAGNGVQGEIQGMLPTKTTIASAFDGWGPTRTDEYTEDPTVNTIAMAMPTGDLGLSIGALGEIAPPASVPDGVVRTGIITRHGDGLPNPLSPAAEAFTGPEGQGLMEILTDTDTKNLSGGALPTLRGTSTVSFGTTSYAYDSLGRIRTQTGTRGSFVATEARQYLSDQPVLIDTLKSLNGPSGTILANPADATVQVGSTFDYIGGDPRIQSGPSHATDKVDGRQESFIYDDLGRVTSHKDVLGVVTTTDYDGWGRVASVKRTAADGSMWTESAYEYDPAGLWKKETVASSDGPSLTTTTTFDALGHVIEVKTLDASGQNGTDQTFAYDGFGQKTDASPVLVISHGATQAWTDRERWAYDALGRVTDHWDAQGRKTLHVLQQPHWDTGRKGVLTVTQNDWDLKNGTSRSEWVDLLGQKSAILDQGGKLSTFAYDKDGHLIKTTQTDPLTQRTQTRAYTYNDMGWLTSRTEPEEGQTLYSTFNLLGTPLTTTQKGRSGTRNEVFTTFLNIHLQPVTITASGPEGTVQRHFTYDPATHLLNGLTETQPYGALTETYAYDTGFFRLIAKTTSDGTQSFTVGQSLFADGRVASLAYPAAAGRADTVAYGYDSLGRVTTVRLNGEAVPSGSQVYDQLAGSAVVDTVTLGNIAWTTTTVDRGEVARVTHSALSGLLEDDLITWSAGGLMLSRGTDHWGYDPLQRLASASVVNPKDNSTVTQTFGYDGFGNRITSTADYGGAAPANKEGLTWTADYPSGNDLPKALAAPGGNL